MTQKTKKTNKSNHHKHEQANGTYKTDAVPSRSSSAVTLKDVVQDYGRCVYAIARIRRNPDDGFIVQPIGSGFLAAPYRLVTAAHVLVDTDPNAPELAKHRDGDAYGFVSYDDNGKGHYHMSDEYIFGQDIFTYPDKDLGIIHFGSDFYAAGMERTHLTISQKFSGIGTPVGVLGYPLTRLEFVGGDFNKPNFGNVLLRADQGVINTRYTTSDDIKVFEFTLAFNHGNSGGPIIDLETGRVISWVKGYRKTDMDLKEKDIPTGFTRREYALPTYIESIQATYSIGFATACAFKELREHNILT